jgi:hypothetical protein
VYALYDDGERVGPLPVIYSHYARGMHYWEVLVPMENAVRMRGMAIDQLPPFAVLTGTLSDAIDPYHWHVQGGEDDD